jgi:hypothetical protein
MVPDAHFSQYETESSFKKMKYIDTLFNIIIG